MTEAVERSICSITTKHDLSVDFAMRRVPQRRWFRRYLDGRIHEPALTEHILDRTSPGVTFIDVGAHLGWFSVLAAARGAQVIAFEMQAGLVPMIQESVALNELDQLVSIVPAGLGSSCGLIPYPAESMAARSGVSVDDSENRLYAPCLTMDAALSDSEPDLIKIDVEGFEGHVLNGGRETLTKHRPSIVMELHDTTEKFGHSIAGVLEILDDLDYDLELFDAHRREGSSRSRLGPEDFDTLRTDSVVVAEPN